MKLGIELMGSSFYYTINRAALRAFEVISLWILIMLLPKGEVALIGITVGFIAVLNLLNVSPYRMIFKNFDEVKKSLSENVSAYMMFWALQSGVMLLLSGIVAYLYIIASAPEKLFIVMMGLVLAYVFANLQLLFQEIFFVSLKQKAATMFNVASILVFLLSLGILALYPSIELYVALIVAKAALTSLGFMVFARKEIGIIFSLPREWGKIVWKSLSEFSIYDHLIGASIELVGRSFLFILGFFVAGAIVADYTIALSLASLLTFFPVVVYRISMLAMTRVSTKEGIEKVLSAFTKYSVILSLAQLAFFALALEPLSALFGSSFGKSAHLYAMLLGLGITIMNAGLPIHAVAVLKSDVRNYFMKIILPVSVCAVASYVLIAALHEPFFIAVVYIFAMFTMNALAYSHVKRTVNVSIQKVFLFPEEKEAARHFAARVFGVKKE